MNDSSVIERSSGLLSTQANIFFIQVYGWMAFGLAITFGVAFAMLYFIGQNMALASFVMLSFPFILIAQLIIVLVLSFLWRVLNLVLSGILFVVYSITMGVFLGAIMFNYELPSILAAIAVTVVTFSIMALYGYFTKQDLTKWGSILLMGLLGLIIATIVNFVLYFIAPGFAESFGWLLTYLGLGLFLILTAYDMQKLKEMSRNVEGDGVGKLALRGALMLYLDFINLFIRILAIMGKRR